MEYCIISVGGDDEGKEKLKEKGLRMPSTKELIQVSLEILTKRVNDKIKEGWIPQGGICESGQMFYTYTQAMIRHKE